MRAEDPLALALRRLPAVERLARCESLGHLPQERAIWAARRVIEQARERILSGEEADGILSLNEWGEQAAALAEKAERGTLRRAINATGVLLHTNLGRATLSPTAARAAAEVGEGHASLETDEETGGRGSRQHHVAGLLCELTGAEDAFVVNNNAAATYLTIAGIAAGREVILSRGQMVEIGGHFRLPDVIAASGGRLVEVGTTNRTRISDYERAITENTALILRCHPSNYRIVGFTEEASLTELVALGQRAGVPVGDDIGSGAMADFTGFGLTDEPMAAASIATGADIVWFSGDKLLGGPQAGILIGKASLLEPLKRHPLNRALRPDKMTLAALEKTLRLYAVGRAWEEIPILRRIARPAEDVLAACGRVARPLRANFPGLEVDIVSVLSEIGGGSLPGHTLPSWAIAIETAELARLARALRQAETPVYGRLERGRLLLDLRAVDESEEMGIITTFQQAFSAA